MAEYTIELRTLVEKMGYNIFDETWTTYVPEHKPVLCDKILRRYYFYEIGQETPDRFKHYLNEQLCREMPYYNQLYASELLKLEPLYNHMLEESGDIDRLRNRERMEVERRDLDTLRQLSRAIKEALDAIENTKGNLDDTQTGTWSENKTGTENTDTTRNLDTTSLTTNDLTKETKQDTTEKMVDSAQSDKTGSSTSNTTTSNTRRYSDTPQGTVSTSGVQIENQYLTNYTRDSGESDTTASMSEKITNSETRDTTTGMTGTETNTGTVDVKGTEKETGSKDVSYSEDKDGQSKDVGNTTTTEDTTRTQTTATFGTETDRSNASELRSGNVDEKEKEGVKSKNSQKGFTVSQAELLEAYRRTFLNIDNMIVESLGHLFMGVF